MHIFLRYDVHNNPISFQVLVLAGIEKQNLNGEKMKKNFKFVALLGLVLSAPSSAWAGDVKAGVVKVQSLVPKSSGNGSTSLQGPSKSRLSSSGSSAGATGCAVSVATNIRADALLEELGLLVGTMSKTSGAVFTYLGNENSMFGAFDIEGAYRSQSARPVKSEPPRSAGNVISVSYETGTLGSQENEQSACVANFQRF